jgi:hypothetical protein
MQDSAVSPAVAQTLESVRHLAVEVGGFASFAELATLALVKQLLANHRPLAARRALKSYLRRHPMTPRIARRLSSLA